MWILSKLSDCRKYKFCFLKLSGNFFPEYFVSMIDWIHGCGTHRQPTVHAFWSCCSHGSNRIIHFKLLCIFFDHVFSLADLTPFLNFSCSCRWELNTQVAHRPLKVKCLLFVTCILHSAISLTFSKCSEITHVIWQKKLKFVDKFLISPL